MRRSVVIRTVTLAACLAVLIVLSSCGGGGSSSDASNEKPKLNNLFRLAIVSILAGTAVATLMEITH